MASSHLSPACDQCCLPLTAGEGHKVHASAVTASEAAVHKGAAEPSLHTGSISEKDVVDKGSYGTNSTIGEAFFQLLWLLPYHNAPIQSDTNPTTSSSVPTS